MAGDIQIRRAGPDDVEAVAALNGALFVEDAGTRDPLRDQTWPKREGLTYFSGFLADRERTVCILATQGDDPVGYLAGRFRSGGDTRPGRVADLESMYVKVPFRSQGVGARLVDAFLAWARERGADRSVVEAYASNEGAVAFYRRHGFQPLTLSLELRLPAS